MAVAATDVTEEQSADAQVAGLLTDPQPEVPQPEPQPEVPPEGTVAAAEPAAGGLDVAAVFR